jgi:hypothetical protein
MLSLLHLEQLSVPALIALVVIGLPVLVVGLNVLKQLVSVPKPTRRIRVYLTIFDVLYRLYRETRLSHRSSSTTFHGSVQLPRTAWTRTSSCSSAGKRYAQVDAQLKLAKSSDQHVVLPSTETSSPSFSSVAR